MQLFYIYFFLSFSFVDLIEYYGSISNKIVLVLIVHRVLDCRSVCLSQSQQNPSHGHPPHKRTSLTNYILWGEGSRVRVRFRERQRHTSIKAAQESVLHDGGTLVSLIIYCAVFAVCAACWCATPIVHTHAGVFLKMRRRGRRGDVGRSCYS